MREAIAALIILFFVSLVGLCYDSHPEADEEARLISAYHAGIQSTELQKNPAWLTRVTTATEHAALMLGVRKHARILESMWDVESDFNPKAKTGNCYGITQLRKQDLPYYYHQLDKVMPGLPPLKDALKYPEVQIALGVMAFKCKLRDAHGNVWQAVRRYNGRGPAAERYRKRVKQIYTRIFKRIRHVGEPAAPRSGARKGVQMRKGSFLGLALLLAMSVSSLKAAEVPEAQNEVVEAVKAPAQLFRDHDFSQGGYGKAVEVQKSAYIAARTKYKATWKLADVKEASRLAFTSATAAWPLVNFANHQLEVEDGDLDQASKALDTAEALLKGKEGKDIDEVKAKIASNRDGIDQQ